MSRIAESELILNDDGSIYHLNLLPEDIGDYIITVGDPNRVERVSKHLDSIAIKKSKREFVTHTGLLGTKQVSIISTGMGPGNIDIFMNELDALVNVDFNTRAIKSTLKSLAIIRLGTSGSIHPDLQTGDLLISEHALGLDTVMSFYVDKKHEEIERYLESKTGRKIPHYWSSGSVELNELFPTDIRRGTTLTAPGFYGAQNRQLRLPYQINLPFNDLYKITINGIPFTNIEMETASIYLFAELLGHKALSINCILANRIHGTFCETPKQAVDDMIERAMDTIRVM